MRKYLLFVLLTACFFTMAEEDYANVVGKVENWIENNYRKGSRAIKIKYSELDEIINEKGIGKQAKIIKLKKAFPKAFVKVEKPLIYQEPISWEIHSLSLGYDITESATGTTKDVDILKAVSSNESESSNSTQSSNISKHKVDAGAGTNAEIGLNPFKWLDNLSGSKIQLHARYVYGKDWTNQRTELWSDRNKEIFLKERAKITEMIHQVGVRNLHLTFAISFTNNSNEEVRCDLKKIEIPVYMNGKLIKSATFHGSLEEIIILAKTTVVLSFRMNLDTTSARELVAFMGNHAPDIRIDHSSIIFEMKESQRSINITAKGNVHTIPVQMSMPGFQSTWNIRKYHTSNSKTVTIREALKAVNDDLYRVAQRDLMKWENGTLVSFSDIPFEISSDVNAERCYFVFLQDNDSKKLIPVNAGTLDQPLPASGITLWSIYSEKPESYENIPSGVKKQILEKLERIAEKEELSNLMFFVGKLYFKGFPNKNEKKAFEWFEKAAEKGNAYAQNGLGYCYYYSKGVEQNYAEAVKWYEKAAAQNHAEAKARLDACYYFGEGVEQNYAEAVKWYQEAAEKGYTVAQYYLGMCYDFGKGVEQNHAEAVKWYREAAEKGDAGAQYNLGLCYAKGEGVEQNYSEAVKWYREAAEKGYAVAQYNLGVCYAKGEGVEKNYAEAVKWFRKAAEQNNAEGQALLGGCYLQGIGVEKNPAKAKELFRKAAAQGFEPAKEALQKMEQAEQ